jgi:hypothetical protein
MNQFVIVVLVIFGLAWLFYMGGSRDKRFAFALWFPLTATSFAGTLLWLWAALGLLTAPSGGGEAAGFAALGAAIALGTFLICPIVFGISFWQRPKAGAYGLVKTVPVVGLYSGLLLCYRPVSETLDNQKLQIVVMDTKMNPVAHAKIGYETNQRSDQVFSFPSSPMRGEVETGADGSALLPVPKTHEINCKVSMNGYASLSIHVDRAWGQYTWHQTSIEWQFPPDNPKKPWEVHGGNVATDVDNSDLMHLTIYLPKTSTETIPNYGPMRVCHEEQPKQIWTKEPSTVHVH